MNGFNVGDAVVCIDGEPIMGLNNGEVYRVVAVTGDGTCVRVSTDRWWDAKRFLISKAVPSADCQKQLGLSVNTVPQISHPTTQQIGGSHYKDMKIQPLEYILANNIPFPEGNVIKYVSRWKKKNGVEDLKKARHMLDMLITHEEKALSK